MIPIRDLSESHLTVSYLQRSMSFFSEVLGLEIAQVFLDRRVAFYWIGGRGGAMLGLREVGTNPPTAKPAQCVPSRPSEPAESRRVPSVHQHDSTQLCRNPTTEPLVLVWMPAASIYFQDTDGNLLEFLSNAAGRPRTQTRSGGLESLDSLSRPHLQSFESVNAVRHVAQRGGHSRGAVG